MQNQTKKTAISVGALKADKAIKATYINNSLPNNQDSVKNETLAELELLFVKLSPASQKHVIDWAKLYSKDKEFAKAFYAWFNEETSNLDEVYEFIDNWKKVCA